jgi:hypothetical protein
MLTQALPESVSDTVCSQLLPNDGGDSSSVAGHQQASDVQVQVQDSITGRQLKTPATHYPHGH